MKNSRRRLQELLGAGDFPAEILTGVPVIEIKGDTETVVINHRGILSYQEDAVRIASGLGPICIRGKDLVIYRMNRERIQLRGSVLAVLLGEELEC